MKKLIMGMAALALLFTSCEKDQPENVNDLAQESVDMSDFYLHTDFNDEDGKAAQNAKNCYSMKNLNRLLKEDDKLYKKMYVIEQNTRSILTKQAVTAQGKPGSGGGGTTPAPTDNLGVISIPVVVTVVYSNTQENISDAQINSQIAVMNADFRGPAATDGIVVGPNYFGNTGYVSAPFDKGRTVTHEVGHYLNLRHIWGDGACRQDDFVADTPSSNGPNYGCPSYPTVNCRTNDMTMNYMDYTNDACMYMFSTGQKSRLRTVFASSGPRAAMAN